MTLKKYLWEKAKKRKLYHCKRPSVMSLNILWQSWEFFIFVFLYIIRAWLTVSRLRIRHLTGSMEGNREGGNTGAAAGKRSQELGDIGFLGLKI